MRNLSDDCLVCKFRDQELCWCIDGCDVPDNILKEIEEKRNKEIENHET